MNKITLSILLSLLTKVLFSQFYSASSNSFVRVEVKNDSAVIGFLPKPKIVNGHYTKVDSIVSLKYVSEKENKLGVYIVDNNLVIVLPKKKKGKRIVLVSENEEKYKKGYLDSYTTEVESHLRHLADSLSVGIEAMNYIPYLDDYPRFLKITSLDGINSQADSIKNVIDSLAKPELRAFYVEINRFGSMSKEEIINFLEVSNYGGYEGGILLKRLSQVNPEVLVEYINTKPINEKEILKIIRWTEFNKTINQNIRKVEGRSRGKRKILKQVRVKNAMNVAGGTLYVTVILAELTGVAALIIWAT